jgi:hypothetical protein
MFQIKVVEKIKTRILCSITISRKSCSLWDKVKNYGIPKATDDMRFASWIAKTTDTYLEYVIHIAFPRKQ